MRAPSPPSAAPGGLGRWGDAGNLTLGEWGAPGSRGAPAADEVRGGLVEFGALFTGWVRALPSRPFGCKRGGLGRCFWLRARVGQVE